MLAVAGISAIFSVVGFYAFFNDIIVVFGLLLDLSHRGLFDWLLDDRALVSAENDLEQNLVLTGCCEEVIETVKLG